MIDAAGRNIDYLRISVTDRCNLRCVYCMPESGVPMMGHEEILTFEEIHAITMLIDSVVGLVKIRVTGGEPLIRRGVVSLVEKLSGIAETVMTTNGFLLAELAPELASAGLSRVNISLDSLKDSVLERVARRGLTLSAVEKAIEAAQAAGLEPVKVNCVVLEGINTGELADMVRWASQKDVLIRFIEHMPMQGSKCGYFSGNDVLDELGPVESLGPDGTAELYLTAEGLPFGLISPICTDMCRACTRVRLTADGLLLPCLTGGEPLDLKTMLRQGTCDKEIMEEIRKLVAAKPVKGRCGGVRMWRIGG